MPGGASKKPNTKKTSPKKRLVKAGPKTTTTKARKKAVPRKVAKKSPKKINLKVRTVSTPSVTKQSPEKVVRKPLAMSTPKTIAAKKKVAPKSKSVKKSKKQTPAPIIAKAKSEARTPRGKVLVQRTEKDKQFLMWAGVSFFMILIVIFWAYNTKESIKRSRVNWESSEKAVAWSQMADELSDKILEIKNDINTVRSFASSSEEQTIKTERESALFQPSSVATTSIDKELIESLKHDLEIKTGISEPSESEYYFILGAEELAVLLAGFNDIKIGDGLDQVKTILDEPSLEQDLSDQRGVFVAKILSYYIKIYKEDTATDSYDKYISLEFDEDNLLVKINKFLD